MSEPDRHTWRLRRAAAETFVASRVDATLALLGVGPPYSAEPPEARMKALLAALPEVRAVRWCEQIHGTAMASIASEPGSPLKGAACVGRGDGLLTDEPGIGLAVWSADCVPALLAGAGVVAAVHAGWRGAAAGLPRAAVRRLVNEYGVDAGDLTAILGPAVGSCHYPVGAEVVAALAATGVARARWQRGDRVDLRAAVAGQLEAAGVPASGIALVGGCTACDPSLASFRRDGEAAGRQVSLIALASG